jgi:hypothetical protein
VQAGRFPCVAEVDRDFAEIAAQRLDDAAAGRDEEAADPTGNPEHKSEKRGLCDPNHVSSVTDGNQA